MKEEECHNDRQHQMMNCLMMVFLGNGKVKQMKDDNSISENNKNDNIDSDEKDIYS